MTGGGPDYGSTTLEFYVYQQAFVQSAFGTGALLGVLLFVLNPAVSVRTGATSSEQDMTALMEGLRSPRLSSLRLCLSALGGG